MMSTDELDHETRATMQSIVRDPSYLAAWVVAWCEATGNTVRDWVRWCDVDDATAAVMMLARAPVTPGQRKALAHVIGMRSTAPLDSVIEDLPESMRPTTRHRHGCLDGLAEADEV